MFSTKTTVTAMAGGFLRQDMSHACHQDVHTPQHPDRVLYVVLPLRDSRGNFVNKHIKMVEQEISYSSS